MSDHITATRLYLLTTYRPLLTLKHLTEVLHSTPSGLRMTMHRKKKPFTCALVGTRHRVGRRIFFEARRLSELIDQDKDPPEASNKDLVRKRGMAQ
jgi:hypothetical protein